jgi:gamma-glutamylcyclotransferase (GGCT)/AIG2-like uncharacterized protein YtfP
MSRTPEEIKKGLECRILGSTEKCDHKCSTCQLLVPGYFYPEVYKDALALVQQLEAENAELLEKIDELEKSREFRGDLANNLKRATVEQEQEIIQLKRERDAAIYDLKKTRECTTCEYVKKSPSESPCVSCGIILKNYEWRGPCEENGGN